MTRRTNMLSQIALIAVLVGATGSLGLTLYAGRRNPSVLLMVLFGMWVLSPYVALVAAHLASKQWTATARRWLDILMLILPAATVALYGYIALGPPRAKTAPVFVIVPPISWALIAVVAARPLFKRSA